MFICVDYNTQSTYAIYQLFLETPDFLSITKNYRPQVKRVFQIFYA